MAENVRTGYFAGYSHCGTHPFLIGVFQAAIICNNSCLVCIEISLASSVLFYLHNSHNHHAAYCIAKAKATSTWFYVSRAQPTHLIPWKKVNDNF